MGYWMLDDIWVADFAVPNPYRGFDYVIRLTSGKSSRQYGNIGSRQI